MSSYRTPLVVDQFYHVFNRGVARQPIFLYASDYKQALFTLNYYRYTRPPLKLSRFKELSREQKFSIIESLRIRDKRLTDIIAFVFMPNHFHFLLRQIEDKGISTFINRFSNSYSKYFNTKHERVGPLLQGVFKSVHIETIEQLIHVSRYVHLNPVTSYIIKESELSTYLWSSFPDYLRGTSELVEVNTILSSFKGPEDYTKFVYDQIDYAQKLDEIKHLVVEK